MASEAQVVEIILRGWIAQRGILCGEDAVPELVGLLRPHLRAKGHKEEIPESMKAAIEKLYEFYPRHVGRGAAVRAIARALKKATPQQIAVGIQRYRDEILRRQTPPEYIAHPATWFNQERWRDEIPESDSDTNEEIAG
jgi:hypothetical protein